MGSPRPGGTCPGIDAPCSARDRLTGADLTRLEQAPRPPGRRAAIRRVGPVLPRPPSRDVSRWGGLCAQRRDSPIPFFDRRHRRSNLGGGGGCRRPGVPWWGPGDGGRGSWAAAASCWRPCRPQAHEHGANVEWFRSTRVGDPALRSLPSTRPCVVWLRTNALVVVGSTATISGAQALANQSGYRLRDGLRCHHRWRGFLDSIMF